MKQYLVPNTVDSKNNRFWELTADWVIGYFTIQ
jgi:hypothetical protein